MPAAVRKATAARLGDQTAHSPIPLSISNTSVVSSATSGSKKKRKKKKGKAKTAASEPGHTEADCEAVFTDGEDDLPELEPCTNGSNIRSSLYGNTTPSNTKEHDSHFFHGNSRAESGPTSDWASGTAPDVITDRMATTRSEHNSSNSQSQSTADILADFIRTIDESSTSPSHALRSKPKHSHLDVQAISHSEPKYTTNVDRSSDNYDHDLLERTLLESLGPEHAETFGSLPVHVRNFVKSAWESFVAPLRQSSGDSDYEFSGYEQGIIDEYDQGVEQDSMGHDEVEYSESHDDGNIIDETEVKEKAMFAVMQQLFTTGIRSSMEAGLKGKGLRNAKGVGEVYTQSSFATLPLDSQNASALKDEAFTEALERLGGAALFQRHATAIDNI